MNVLSCGPKASNISGVSDAISPRFICESPRSTSVPQAMAQFVLKIEKLSHIMGATSILEMACAYGLQFFEGITFWRSLETSLEYVAEPSHRNRLGLTRTVTARGLQTKPHRKGRGGSNSIPWGCRKGKCYFGRLASVFTNCVDFKPWQKCLEFWLVFLCNLGLVTQWKVVVKRSFQTLIVLNLCQVLNFFYTAGFLIALHARG